MNRSEVIREAIKNNPTMGGTALAAMLTKQHPKETFSVNLVNAVKYSLKKEQVPVIMQKPNIAPETVSIDDLTEVKALAAKVGGLPRLIRLATLVAA